MKVAVVYNRESKNVINLFGVPNREKYGLQAIKRISDALKQAGHNVISLEGDKDLIHRLEEFMPRVLKGERPGMVFNLSYGIQGQARYTHVPSILEMMGLPYVGSGPLAHSLALDKVVAKILFRQHGIPTPEFVVLNDSGFDLPTLRFPLIVKPKNESTSFGMSIVYSEDELRKAAQSVFDEFMEPALVEEYIDGREVNVGLLGNNPPEAFPPVELHFDEGPPIYTYADKTRQSDREVRFSCPAGLSTTTTKAAQELALRAFRALGCVDCARVDMRLGSNDLLYVLEVNSLPSLGERGSYSLAASAAGLDFPELVKRLVEVASQRYFGTPQPPALNGSVRDKRSSAFAFLTKNRDAVEKRLKQWTAISSRSEDPVGHDYAFVELERVLSEVGIKKIPLAVGTRSVRMWETTAGYEGGLLFIGHTDVPLALDTPVTPFRREPEWLYGEGIGISRSSLVILEFMLRALRAERLLQKTRLGVLYYGDEGLDCRHSADHIRNASSRAGRVFVLRPGTPKGNLITGRRGLRRYRLTIEGTPVRLGAATNKEEMLQWLYDRLADLSQLTDRKARIAVAATDIKVHSIPMMLPHRAVITIRVSYPSNSAGEQTEKQVREILGDHGRRWELALVSDRPPMIERKENKRLAQEFADLAAGWGIELAGETSVFPSVAGLVPAGVPVLCGLGPSGTDWNTPQERISRISLVQRTLVLTQYLISLAQGNLQ